MAVATPDGAAGRTDGPERAAERVLASVTVRPDVPMQMYTCLPQVLALGLARALAAAGLAGARVAWPNAVAVDGDRLLRVDVRAGYDEGMFGNCDVVLLAGDDRALPRGEELVSALEQTCAQWEDRLRRACVVAGPLAPLLDDYFDTMDAANERVEVVYPNGRVAARGVLAGLDVWGRASVRTDSGRELSISPEQASIRRERARA
ncbi:MAG: hypothetical protein ACI4B2_05645 [Parafannyhessea sp.]|uniref:hypothetical protein n=1 Tax=Parafannyhessea sp. TaxID=2847324 RepID=UPI003EFEE26E